MLGEYKKLTVESGISDLPMTINYNNDVTKKEFENIDPGKRHIKVAVMGCVVNGPGEAAEADIGIAGGDGCAMLISRGKVVGKIDEKDIIGTLRGEVLRLITEG